MSYCYDFLYSHADVDCDPVSIYESDIERINTFFKNINKLIKSGEAGLEKLRKIRQFIETKDIKLVSDDKTERSALIFECEQEILEQKYFGTIVWYMSQETLSTDFFGTTQIYDFFPMNFDKKDRNGNYQVYKDNYDPKNEEDNEIIEDLEKIDFPDDVYYKYINSNI